MPTAMRHAAFVIPYRASWLRRRRAFRLGCFRPPETLTREIVPSLRQDTPPALLRASFLSRPLYIWSRVL
jgi:hypothetical protein